MIAVLSVPIAALVAIWLLSTSVTIGDALQLYFQRDSAQKSGDLASIMIRDLQSERTISLVYLAGGRQNQPELTAQRVKTDATLHEFRTAMSNQYRKRDIFDKSTLRARDNATAALESIALCRESIDSGRYDVLATLQFYSSVIETQFRSFSAFANISHPQAAAASRPMLAFARASEVLAQQDALTQGVMAAGEFVGATYTQLVQLIGAQRNQFELAVSQLPDKARSLYVEMVRTEAFAQLTRIEGSLLSLNRTTGAPPRDVAGWPDAYSTVSTALFDYHTARQHEATEAYGPLAASAMKKVAATGGAGTLAIILTIILSIRIGRSFINRLARLRVAAVELAEWQLPATVARLRRGETVDVDSEVPPLYFGQDEIGEVGTALNAVRRTAIASAVEESRMRDGMNQVFLNIARRNQNLLHRQLTVLDSMERRTTEPADLRDLFHVDHMAARMRRHAEDLVILAGSTPARLWNRPAPVIDLLRGAISEIEEYQRINIDVNEDVSFHGECVLDLIHLLAELLENATSFSPPHTPVHLIGQRVPHGYVIEIEDRGVGLSPAALIAANERLDSPPEFDPAKSEQLGLYVASLLAKRNGIKVALRTSPYGGISAIVLVPTELIVTAPAALPGPAPTQGAAEMGTATPPAVSPNPPGPPVGPAGPSADSDPLEGLPKRVRQASNAARSPKTTALELTSPDEADLGHEPQPQQEPAWNADTITLATRVAPTTTASANRRGPAGPTIPSVDVS